MWFFFFFPCIVYRRTDRLLGVTSNHILHSKTRHTVLKQFNYGIRYVQLRTCLLLNTHQPYHNTFSFNYDLHWENTHANNSQCYGLPNRVLQREHSNSVYCDNLPNNQPSGPGSSVGIATGYGAGRSGDRIPVGARFFAPVQNGPGAYPASCTMGTGSFPGVKSGRGPTLTPSPPSSAVVMKG